MHPILPRTAAFVLASLAAAGPAGAIDFTVTSLFDASIDHDVAPGDGVCASARGGSCSLRAAIEEANARSGQDRILFSVEGVVALSTEGPLPAINDPLVILGSSAPGYNISATRIGQAPPRVWIDGTFLGGSTADGLVFTSGATSGFVDALGIVAMPDDGVVITGSATQVTIDDCWIGVRADGTAGGNSGVGINLNADGNFIGALANVGGISGLGNLVSGNGSHGILINAGADNNRIRGNWIGLNAAGSGARANAGWGILSSGSDNRIGELHLGSTPNAPIIVANTSGGIQLFGGTGNRIEASVLGLNVNGSNVNSPGDGILVVAGDSIVGGTDPLQGNTIANHARGIHLGTSVLNASNTIVRNNRIGAITFSQGVTDEGIHVERGSGNQLRENLVLNAGTDGILVQANGTVVQGNRVGFSPSIFGPQAHGSGEMGIRVHADGTSIGNNIVGFSGMSPSGFNDGIIVRGSNNSVQQNFVGVTPEGDDIGNVGAGIRIGSTSETSADNTVRGNTIMHNSRGVWLFGDPTNIGNTVELNTIDHNASIAVDLIGEFGRDSNDVGDADEGVNRLQNTPEIVSLVADLEVTPATLDITYLVDSNSSAAAYPMLVDFHLGRPFRDDAVQYLGTDIYSLASARLQVTRRVNLPPGMTGGWLVAQAHDGDGNSSEITLSMPFGEFDAVFRDGFETP